jgi:hypothetical protein
MNERGQPMGSDKPKYEEIHVDLIGEDGNAFVIIARVMRAMRRAGVLDVQIEEFRKEATSGDYDNVIQTVMKWVNVS